MDACESERREMVKLVEERFFELGIDDSGARGESEVEEEEEEEEVEEEEEEEEEKEEEEEEEEELGAQCRR